MKTLALCRRALWIGAAYLMTGCGGASPPAGLPGNVPQRQTPPWAMKATQPDVFVANQGGVLDNGSVNVYDAGLRSLVHHIVRGAQNPFGIAVDSTGRLYVLAAWHSVTEFDRGAYVESRRIKDLFAAFVMAFDRSNDLYIASCYSCMPKARSRYANRDAILEYRAGTKMLIRTITEGIHSPHSLALDSTGNLYVANGAYDYGHQNVTVYAPDSIKVLRKLTGFSHPGILAVDPADNLYVTNGNREILIYSSGGSEPVRRIGTGIASPQALAFDASGSLYVANTVQFPQKGWVSVYKPGSSSESYEITEGISNPVTLAVDPSGRLYVDDNDWQYPLARGRITIYAPGSMRPERSVRWSRKFGYPLELALGPG